MAQLEREQVEEQYKWDLTPLYNSVEDWRKAKEALEAQMSKIRDFKGRLADSASTLYEYLHQDSENQRILSKLYLYASLKSDQDVSKAENLALVKEMEQVDVNYSQLTDFDNAELAAISDETYASFFAAEPRLQEFSMIVDASSNDVSIPSPMPKSPSSQRCQSLAIRPTTHIRSSPMPRCRGKRLHRKMVSKSSWTIPRSPRYAVQVCVPTENWRSKPSGITIRSLKVRSENS